MDERALIFSNLLNGVPLAQVAREFKRSVRGRLHEAAQGVDAAHNLRRGKQRVISCPRLHALENNTDTHRL